MARPLRIEYEGAFYHIIQRGIERRNIFISEKDKGRFFSYLNGSFAAYSAIFHSYVLMDNHYHLILETPQANLSKIMHYLNTSYATYFNAKHKRSGPLYQGRFKAVLVEQDEYLHYLSCYIHLNPVRAGIVKSPEEYPYSSYSLFISKREPPQWLNTAFILSMFNKNFPRAKHLYKQFVSDNIGKEKDFIDTNTKKGIILGSEVFFDHIRTEFIDKEDKEDTEIPLLKALRHKKESSLSDIKSLVEKSVTTDHRLRRSIAIYLSRKYTQKTLNEIAEFYGGIKYTGVSQVYRRISQRRLHNKDLDGSIAKIETKIINCQK